MRSIQRTLAMAMTLAVSTLFLPLGCGGSMPAFDPAAPPHSDGDLPDDIAREVRTCTAEHITHLGTADHSIAFDVKLDSDGEVDSVALIASTVRDDELLVCMSRALRSLTEDDLPLRSGKRSGGMVTPESRALAGQLVEGGLAAACLAAPAGCVLVLGITAIGGAVYVYVFTHPSTKPGPIHHHPPPTVEEPIPTAVPAPTTVAPPVATVMPMATVAPTAPTMPTALPLPDQDLWRKCNQQHDAYKDIDKEDRPLAKQAGPLEDLLNNNKASAQQRVDFCGLLTKRIKLAQQEYKGRSKYIDMDCDKFDWFNKGLTKAQRLAKHKDELGNVNDQLKTFYDLEKRFCK